MSKLCSVRREDWESLKPTVYGWGINDVDYVVQIKEELPKVNGKRKRKTMWVCPYYQKWKSILQRCFGKKTHERQPTYKGCTVHENWMYLSNFIKWVDSQPNKDWINCEPDKDILFEGDKHYSPETVVFVSSVVNRFIIGRRNDRGGYMIGVSYAPHDSKKNPYISSCSNPFNIKDRYRVYYPTELEAHLAWQAKKHEYACMLADLQEDERVAKALRERYAPDKDWTKA